MRSNFRYFASMLFVLLGCCYPDAQTSIGQLGSGETASGSIRKAQVLQYELQLAKNDMVFVDLIQYGVDLILTAIGSDSIVHESDYTDTGKEVLLLHARENDTYQIMVSVFEEKGSGSYQLIIGERTEAPSDEGKLLNTMILHWMNRNYLPGLGTVVVTKDEVLFSQGYGFSDVASKEPYRTSTIQNIGSVSKTTIGLSLVKLVDEGKLDLDTPINDILPFEVKNHWHPDLPITVRHLATHTSTINDGPLYDYSYVMLEENDYEKDELNKDEWRALKQLSGHEKVPLGQFVEDVLSVDGKSYYKKTYFKDVPGKRYRYSNIAAGLAAHIVEIISGMPYPEFTAKYIFDPLRMDDTGWRFEDIDITKHASLYFSNNKTTIPRYTLNTYPDGGLLTSINDLSKYLQELIKGHNGHGSILSAAAYQEMMSAQLKPSHFNRMEERGNAGLFWEINSRGSEGHSGGDPGIVTRMYFYPDKQTGAVIFTNSGLDSPLARAQFGGIWNLLMQYASDYGDS